MWSASFSIGIMIESARPFGLPTSRSEVGSPPSRGYPTGARRPIARSTLPARDTVPMTVHRPLVLCYHAISDEWVHRLAIRPEVFERQLRSLLRRRFRPATAEAVADGRGRLLHVTFDDAYRSIDRAVAIAASLSIPVTVFAASAYADDGPPARRPRARRGARGRRASTWPPWTGARSASSPSAASRSARTR